MISNASLPASNPYISVVVIARNEEQTIESCIASGIHSLAKAIDEGLARGGEVIFVDSNSTDRTLDRAKTFPVTIIQLGREAPPSAAAGRQIGLEHSRGELVYFIDGDTVVESGWLPRALRLLNQPGVAGVSGRFLDSMQGNSVLARHILDLQTRDMATAEIQESDAVCVGLFRRDVLERVGGFHPFLKGSEDLDLGLRIRAEGWRLLQTRSIMALHHWSAAEGDVNYVDYLRSVAWWSFGAGQACRYRFHDTSLRLKYIRRYISARFALEYLRGLFLATPLLVQPALWFLLEGSLPALAAVDAALVGLLTYVRSRLNMNWSEFLFSFHGPLYSAVRHTGFLLGLLRRVADPKEYPRQSVLLQRGSEWDRAAISISSAKYSRPSN